MLATQFTCESINNAKIILTHPSFSLAPVAKHAHPRKPTHPQSLTIERLALLEHLTEALAEFKVTLGLGTLNELLELIGACLLWGRLLLVHGLRLLLVHRGWLLLVE